MYSEEELQLMTPTMSIDYRVEKGLLHSGTFDNVPEKAFGACVSTCFPGVNANGEFMILQNSFDLFVGKSFEVDDLLSQVNNPPEDSLSVSKDRLEKYKRDGVKIVVATEIGIIPLKEGDAVFSTHEEMASAISKINNTFNSVSISIQNNESTKRHL